MSTYIVKLEAGPESFGTPPPEVTVEADLMQVQDGTLMLGSLANGPAGAMFLPIHVWARGEWKSAKKGSIVTGGGK